MTSDLVENGRNRKALESLDPRAESPNVSVSGRAPRLLLAMSSTDTTNPNNLDPKVCSIGYAADVTRSRIMAWPKKIRCLAI
jgi:hypothetical protein